jgi:hypothetical protein
VTVRDGDRFVQVWPPPGGAVVEVERHLGEGEVAIRRENGARQVFPVSTLEDGRYWAPASGEENPHA